MLDEHRMALPEKDRLCMDEALRAVRSLYEMEEVWDENKDGAGGTLRLRRSGRTLVTFLILDGRADVMVIFGKKEREAFDAYRDSFSQAVKAVYDESHTYHDGKWMRMPLSNDEARADLLRLLAIKKRPNKKVTV